MLRSLLPALALALFTSPAFAQAWPTKPVKMIVPFPAGGPTDVLTRVLSEKLGTALGQPVVVDNKPGAGGGIGTDLAAKSPNDGYTLLMATGSTHSVGPYLQKLPYDPVKDFVPVIYVGYATNIMLISPKVPAKTVPEFIALAKKEPGKYNYSTSGIGSVAHLTSEMFAAQAGIKLTHVPYKGTQLSIPDLVQGNVAILFDNVMTSKPHLDSGRLNALGISSLKRSTVVPAIPTIDESGLKGFDSWNYFGIYAPAGTPKAITDRINAEMNKILSDPAVKDRFHQLGFEITGGTSEEFAKVMASESAKWSKVIREANVKAE